MTFLSRDREKSNEILKCGLQLQAITRFLSVCWPTWPKNQEDRHCRQSFSRFIRWGKCMRRSLLTLVVAASFASLPSQLMGQALVQPGAGAMHLSMAGAS